MLRYLSRRDKDYRSVIRQQATHLRSKTTVSPTLKIGSSTAVRNHKRKLKNSRRNCFSMLQILPE